MHGLVVDVGTETLGGVEAVAESLRGLAEVLLLIADVMLGACNYSSVLYASDGGIDQCAGEIWIGTETFLGGCQT